MLRTRTNDTVEILDASKYFKEASVPGLYIFDGISVDDLFKHNIIYFSKQFVKDGRPIIGAGTYFYLQSGVSKSYINIVNNDAVTRIYIAFSNNFSIVTTRLVTDGRYEDLVKSIPTDVRLVEDEGKLQLQLEHDSEVLSIDEGVNDVLNNIFCSYVDITRTGATFKETNNKLLFGEEEDLMQITDISTLNTLFDENIFSPAGGKFVMLVASKIEYEHYAIAKLCAMHYEQTGTSIKVKAIQEISDKMFFTTANNLYYIKHRIVTDSDTTLKTVSNIPYGLVSLS